MLNTLFLLLFMYMHVGKMYMLEDLSACMGIGVLFVSRPKPVILIWMHDQHVNTKHNPIFT